ncbi:hypothetical protein [Mycobacteroides abscessus]|uniref:hypothetical protein n=1 Tax=Mycobacteroides abscessus TaxID=36809 RepID=UPI001D0C4F2F|nr:hypothetical protein [Mycobacteroides abscessus]
MELWPWLLRWLVYSAMVAPLLAVLVLVGDYPEPGLSERWHSPGTWIALAAGVPILGLVMTITTAVRRDKLAHCLAGVLPAQYGQVAKAAVRGPVPADPAVRVAAGRLAWMQFERLNPFSRISPWVFAVCALLQIPDFFDSDGAPTLTRVLSLMMFTAMAVYYWQYPRVLDARAQLLLAAPSNPAPSTGAVEDGATIVEGS